MFRWLAVCVVLCAGAFALVALATGRLFPSKAAAPEVQPDADVPVTGDDGVQIAPAGQGGDHGGAIVLANARLAPIEREDAPSQHDGTVQYVATDEQGDLSNDRKLPQTIRLYFLAVKIWAKTAEQPVPPAAFQSQGLVLLKTADGIPSRAMPYAEAIQELSKLPTPAAAPDAAGQARHPEDALYRPWLETDPLVPHNIEVAYKETVLYQLKEGDWVKPHQLVAMVDPSVQVNDVALKVNKVETADSEFLEAGKTAGEADRRAAESRRLWQTGGPGAISMDAYYADLLNAARYREEEKGKDSARQGAVQELRATLTLLKLHEVRAVMPGVVKTIYKHPGEAVKNLDPIMHIENPLELRVEAQAGAQDAQSLREGLIAIVQPTHQVSPLASLQGHQAAVTCVAVSRPGADGRKLIVSGSDDGTVRFWDAQRAQHADPASPGPQVAWQNQHSAVLAVACTGPKAEHNLALTGDRDGVGRIIDLDRLPPPPALAAAAGNAAHLLQAQPIKLSERHRGPITCVAFSPNGDVCATGGEDRAIRLWRVADGKLLVTLNAAHKAAVTSVSFAQPDGDSLQLASAGGDNTLGVWRLDNFDNLNGDKDKPAPNAVSAAVLPYRSGDVARPGVSADGRHLLFDHGNELRVLSLETKQIEGVIQAPGSAASFTTMAVFAPDGATILTNSASEGRLQLWRSPIRLLREDVGRALELRQFTAPAGSTATCGAFDPAEQPGFVVTGSRDGYLYVWQMPDAEEVQRKPREAVLAPLDRSLESGARQMRVWADLEDFTPDFTKDPQTSPEQKLEKAKAAWLKSGLTPGGTATLIILPAK